MPWPGVEQGIAAFLRRKVPTLLVAADWTENHCVVPDGVHHGEWFVLRNWQLWAFLSWYRVRPDAAPAFSLGEDDHEIKPVSTFFYRRAQVVLPQKAGKAPYTSAKVCVEGVGPAVFSGWAHGREVYECAEWGCPCGWTYRYEPGEPMARPWPTPLIQITAFSEKQTDNIYSALKPMIDDGPLSAVIPKTGEEFIRLPHNGRIDKVTSEARSRLGARVTYVPQDESGIWTESADMITVADTQRRGLAGMGGRAEETTNAWDPNKNSQAQRTAAAAKKTGDIFRLHPLPESGLSYRNKDERQKIHRDVYAGCDWIDLSAIEGEAAEVLIEDPAQAERFFGNRPVAGAGVAFDAEAFKKLARPRVVVPTQNLIVVGVDGARFMDALAIVATDIRTGFQWPLDIIERPDDAPDDYEHDFDRADAALKQAMERYRVWRVYIDPQKIELLVERWANRYGQKRIIEWWTYKERQTAWAVREYEQAIGGTDSNSRVTHSGDATFVAHIENAQKRELNVKDDQERPMHTLAKESIRSPLKIDGAMAAVVLWKARGDALEMGIVKLDPPERDLIEPPPKPPAWVPGTAPAIDSVPSGDQVPAGFMT